MPSLRARFLAFLLRNRHLFRFRRKERAVDWTKLESIVRFRRECEAGAARFGSMPSGIDIEPVSAGGLEAEWILPSRASKDAAIPKRDERRETEPPARGIPCENDPFRRNSL